MSAFESFAGVDLNLLIQLGALLEERSVTQAARRLGRTQSGLSHALGKLRELFDDPLLVRSGSEMVLTPRAQELQPALEEALASLGALLRPAQGFEPAKLRHSVTLSMTDMIELALLPGLLHLLEIEAPGLRVRCKVSASPEQDVQAGESELAIGVFWRDLSGLIIQPLARERFVGLVSAEHSPFDPAQVTLAQYAQARHLLVTPRGEHESGVVDRALKAHGLERQVVALLPHFVTAALILARTRAVLTVPASIAHQMLALGVNLLAFEPPLELPEMTSSMLFHQSRRRDPAHMWLRALVQRVARDAYADREAGS